MPNTVLLARPHPFIAAEMRGFLEEGSYVPKKLETLDSLPGLINGTSGVVISLALSSAVGESAEDVFQQVRSFSPRVPVLFASMLPLDKARVGLERVLKKTGAGVIHGLDTAQAASSRLGHPETLLYFSKEDLTSPERRAVAARLIRRHFQ